MKEVDINFALKRKYPERVALVSCTDISLKSNVISLGWFMQTSFSPCLVVISVGLTRYSHELIKKTKEFVLALPSKNMKEEVLFCGTHSGRNIDKFKEMNLKTKSAKFIKPPLLEDCVVNLECKVISELLTGDHTIFIGEILTSYINEKEDKILLNFGDYKFGSL